MKLKHACVDAGQYGINVSPDEYRSSGIRMLRTSDLSDAGVTPPEDGIFLQGPIPPEQILQEGDLLLSRAGTIGRSYLVPPAAAGDTFAGFLVRFRPSADTDARFLWYALRTKGTQDQIRAEAVSSTIQNFNADRYANLDLPDVHGEEQRRIADFLDDRVARIDQIITARRQQLAVVESLSWSAFSSEVTRADMPRLPLRRAIASLADGPFGSAFSSDDYVDAGPAVIRLGNIGFAEFRQDYIARIPQEIYDRFPNAHVSPGDLLIASLGDARNHAGRACVAPADLGPTMVKGKCFVARANHAIATEAYLATLLSSPAGAEHLVAQGTGATRSMLNFDRLLSTVLPIPDTARQTAILRDFSQANETAATGRDILGGLVDSLHEYRQSLITAAVTGEIDVTTAGSGIQG